MLLNGEVSHSSGWRCTDHTQTFVQGGQVNNPGVQPEEVIFGLTLGQFALPQPLQCFCWSNSSACLDRNTCWRVYSYWVQTHHPTSSNMGPSFALWRSTKYICANVHLTLKMFVFPKTFPFIIKHSKFVYFSFSLIFIRLLLSSVSIWPLNYSSHTCIKYCRYTQLLENAIELSPPLTRQNIRAYKV